MNFKDWLFIEVLCEKVAEAPQDQGTLFNKEKETPSQRQLPPDRMKKFVEPSGRVCVFDAFTRDQQQIGAFARKSPENMAQVAMFSPLSARTLFANLEKQFPVVVYILQYLFGKRKVAPKELEGILKYYFNKQGANTRSVVFGFKLDTVADIWNNRNQIYNKAMSMYNAADPEKSDTEGLIKLFSGLNQEVGNLAGIAPVKAGFIVQLIFGQAGCIDVHNIRIYQQLSNKMGWGQGGQGKQPLPSKDIDPDNWKKTDQGVANYIDVLTRLKERGIGTKELWNIWVDFVGQIYQQAKLVKPDEPALNPLDPQYKDFSGMTVRSKAPAWMLGGKGRKETDVGLPIASGDEAGGEISNWHRRAASPPEDLLGHSDIGQHYPFLSGMAQAKNSRAAKQKMDQATAWKRRQGQLF